MQESESEPSIGPVFGGDLLEPPYDPMLADLLTLQIEGRLTRYWAAVPRGLVAPFAAEYDPSTSSTWAPVFHHLVDRMRAGAYPNLTTYQRGDAFITSDDYLAYLAYEAVAPEWVACYVLGEPDSAAITSVRLAPEEAARREAAAHGRDFEASRLLFEYLQRAEIRALNGHPPEEPAPRF
jgi:hypothetical protein